MSEKLLAHADLAAWFAHAFDSAAMDLGTTRRGGGDLMAREFEHVELDGVTYYWSGWQPRLRSVLEPDGMDERIVACWQVQIGSSIGQCNVIADVEASDTEKAQKKENALNSLRDRIQHPEQYQFLDSN